MADDSFDLDSISSLTFHDAPGPSSHFNDAYWDALAGGRRNLREEYLEMGRKFREVEQQRKALDATVAELKEAVLLRMEMDQCASRRETPSVRVELEVTFLYPETMLVAARITNESSFHFKNWHLSFTFSPQVHDESQQKDKVGPRTVCEAVPIACLPEGHRFDVKLTTITIRDADALVEITLHKRFQVGQEAKIFRIELDPCAITKWDLLQAEPYVFPRPLCKKVEDETEEKEKDEEHSDSLRLPHKMMYLLVGGKNATVTDVVRYILPKNFAKATDETPTITGFVPMGQSVAEVNVEVRRQDLCATVKISSASDRLVKDLVAGLQRRILSVMTENFAFNANRQTHRGVGIKQWRLVARNLPFETKKEELEEFFGNHGHVLEVVLPKCKDKRFPDSCAGFAFVQYASKGSAENAKKTANFSEFKGRKIAVDYAVDKDTYVTVTHPEKETIEKAERKVLKEEPDAKRKLKPKTKASQKTTEKLSSLKIKEELSSDAEEEEDEEVRSETKEPPKKKFKDGGKTKKEPQEAVKQEPKEEQEPSKPEKKSDAATAEGRVVFIRNLSFDSTNEMIKDQMSRFGEVSLAIMCKYPSTDQPTGTAFVHFKEKEAADQCLDQLILEEGVSIDGRKIYGYRAVPRDQASAFKEKEKKPKDKRNLYLLRASLIRPGTAQARGMSDEDAEKRARLAEMARTKLKNLHMFVSPNRLAIHNIPFSMSVQELRSACMLATKNVDAEVTECRIMRNKKGEDTHGRPLLGKSKGFGFVAFKEHDDALRCLRNLNNNPETFTNDKRPIVEFSIENLNAIKLQERRKAKSLGEGAQSEGRQKPKAPPRRTSSAVEETKQEMRSGGQKWMPKKVGVKIRHRDLKKGKKLTGGGGAKKGKGRGVGGKKVIAKKTGKKVGGGKRKGKGK